MENNEEVNVSTETNESESQVETIAIAKADYEKLNQTLGSLKRELKDYKKSQEATKETKEDSKPDNSLVEKLERMALRQAGITDQDDIDLAKKTAKKWGMDIDEVINDEDFKSKLERQQTTRSNAAATSNIKGSASTSSAKNTAEYWQAKGVPPTPADVPDRKTRANIVRSMMKNSGSSKKFYND